MRDEIINEIVSGLKLPPAIAAKLLNQYLETLPKDVAQLKESIEEEDYQGAAKTAHSIKGASGNLRITKISQLAGELEQILKSEQNVDAEKVNVMVSEIYELTKQLV